MTDYTRWSEAAIHMCEATGRQKSVWSTEEQQLYVNMENRKIGAKGVWVTDMSKTEGIECKECGTDEYM
jgi:hypothetical protein